MNKLDVQGRMAVPKGIREFSDTKECREVLIIHEEGMKYRVVPLDKIPKGAKIFVAPQVFDTKGRLIIPKIIRDRYTPEVQVYVQDSKLYFEFEALKE